ncbi:FeoA domain-containing protein, partial [uncultured Ruminococcus sp.]|uniref:FeoA domain-containing protein n=1 Tax=uncultured Ruminococcus sp. TaxID=165186 RepID=UPI0025DD2E48
YLRTDEYGGKNGSHSGKLNAGSLSSILKNPLYVRADKDVYAFFQSRGYEIIDEVEAYDGVHGVFMHDNADGGKYVKVGYHEGLVSSELWLRVQDKKSTNRRFQTNRKVLNSWLVGLLKCKECGLSVIIDMQKKSPTNIHRYLADSGWLTIDKCVARKYSIRIDDIEESVYAAMCERLQQIEIAHDRFVNRVTAIGITEDVSFGVVRNDKKMPVLIYLRETLIALNRDDAERIEVKI